MDFAIRKMHIDDKNEVLSMMKEFYSSDAVFSNGSDIIFETDFENCLNENPYLEGYVFYSNTDILGYAMIAKSFSTEFGKQCIWFEDLYIKQNYPNCIFRLEVEAENLHAVHVYEKKGFKQLPYTEMISL